MRLRFVQSHRSSEVWRQVNLLTVQEVIWMFWNLKLTMLAVKLPTDRIILCSILGIWQLFFTPTTTAVSNSIILTLALDNNINAAISKDITLSVKDTLNSSTVTETVSVEILPSLTCELTFGFPGNQAGSNNIYTLTPERSYVLAGNFNCVDPLENYELKTSMVQVQIHCKYWRSGSVSSIANDDVLIYSHDSKILVLHSIYNDCIILGRRAKWI